MRGVLAASTDARLLDVTHEFPRGDIRTAAFWLREILPYFPPAVHLVVVDPGVGTDRRVLVVQAGDHALVGPDNGVLWPAAEALSDAPSPFALTAFEAESDTFHGRDVFAPLAADVHDRHAGGVEHMADLSPIDDPVEYRLPVADVTEDCAIGEVIVIDGFGNVITNIPGAFVENHIGGSLEVDGTDYPVAKSYAHVTRGQPLVTIGSHGNVELAANDARGARIFDLGVGDRVRLDR